MTTTCQPGLPASMHQLLAHRRVLMLQGPMGPFFLKLATFLEAHGSTVCKVNFNGGDAWFHPGRGSIGYAGTPGQWPTWLAGVLRQRCIDAVVLFGQARPIHAAALRVARQCHVPCYVFEEGYFRPDYVTLERGGVNASSSLPRSACAIEEPPVADIAAPSPTGHCFRAMAAVAVQYSLAAWAARPWFPHHRHHRDIDPFRGAALWLRSGWRKLRCAWTERKVLDELCGPERCGRWFLLALQVPTDSQIVHHSRFDGMVEVIDEVVASFAAHAPIDRSLVIKHHPMDRAHNDYASHIRMLEVRHGLRGRIRYVHDLDLATLLRHCAGVVTVNSTTGLQAMLHGAPVCTLEDCYYSLAGLVDTRPLAQFWSGPRPADQALYRRFRQHVIHATQLNASFYALAPALGGAMARAGRGISRRASVVRHQAWEGE